jgi:stearoyl-CoA desaturase (delta-9 desaturase)
MLDSQTLEPPPAILPRKAGVKAANARARRLQQRIALAVVVIPFLGVLAAIVLLWGWGIGPVELGLMLGMFALTMLGTGAGLHRYFAHGAFQTGSAVRVAFAVLGSMAAQGPILYWVAIHRRHHAHSDQPGDPHSPNFHGDGVLGTLRGLWHAHVGWMFVHEVTDWPRYINDLLRDRTLFAIHRTYFWWVALGLAIPAALGGALTGTWTGAGLGLLWGGLVRIFLAHHAAWSIGSVCHVFGTTPFETHDESRNNPWIALYTFGESWHNNHHAFPYSAWHGLRWWQIDLNGCFISLLTHLGLAWSAKAPPPRLMEDIRKGGPCGVVTASAPEGGIA